jgi:hypothetical protein
MSGMNIKVLFRVVYGLSLMIKKILKIVRSQSITAGKIGVVQLNLLYDNNLIKDKLRNMEKK